ncbi:MAG: phosphoribosylamine--glycine ligase [Bacillati bacterium ANGP1]|uniref:Phosphoribosylamine--glycine ligase n=1 Tax=Candidatus Segetimicrobium genomatis TaxID=2569760 RepID=A0A537JPL2_9BACT|nr:MAG: phosphoribosylamine--glycine ligase [Terrabacteria group bacterium ANGP1]
MKVLVIGSGGREHAMAWKLRQESTLSLFCAPGNPGIGEIAPCLPLSSNDIGALAACAEQYGIDLTFVGPEAPLAAGLVDLFERRGLRAFGPTQAAARLESSKAFMKTLCRRYGIPTAPFAIFDDPARAIEDIRGRARPCVIKVDGLAAGKGVTVAATAEEAIAAVEAAMVARRFGDAGARVIVEEMLSGEEVSVFALCDGTAVCPLLAAQDHKRLGDLDRGPNTGGMGAYAITDQVLEPVVWAMAQEGRRYRGVLFAGLMLTADGPQVLEFNVRLGDPEAQVLLPLLESGLVEAAEAVLSGSLERWTPRWRPESAVGVVLAADGYPDSPRTGDPITGLPEAAAVEGVRVFHAGDNLNEARTRAYRAVDAVRYEGKIYRRDIGARAAGRGRIRPPADERSAAGPGREGDRKPIEARSGTNVSEERNQGSRSQRSVGHR